MAASAPSDQQSMRETLDDLMHRTTVMIREVDQLSELVTSRHQLPAHAVIPGLAAFSRGLATEFAGLQKLADSSSDPSTFGKVKAVIAAANIPHYEARWATVKRRRQLVSMAQVFRRQDRWTIPAMKKPSTKGMSFGQAKGALRNHRIQNSAECDAVVEGGAEWIKVSAASNRRWIQQMAEAGICIESDDEGADSNSYAEQDYEDDIIILRTVKHLAEASRANPYKLLHYPRIRVVLTKIEEGCTKEIDWLINRLRRLGRPDVEVVVDCLNGDFLNSPVPPIEEALQNLLTAKEEEAKSPATTHTLNVDTYVLLGYISDITHSHCKIEEWHKPEIKHYIHMENEGGEQERFVPLVNSIISGHRISCIRAVLENFRRIVTTIATDTERERYRLILPWDELDQEDRDALPGPNMTAQERLEKFQSLSQYQIPKDIELPIQVVDGVWDMSTVEQLVSENKLPPFAVPAVKGMGTAFISSFIYGWHSHDTTVTCYNYFVDRFLSLIELYGKEFQAISPENRAPSILKVQLFRSLLAKRRPEHVPPPPRRVMQGQHWKGIKIVPPRLEENLFRDGQDGMP